MSAGLSFERHELLPSVVEENQIVNISEVDLGFTCRRTVLKLEWAVPGGSEAPLMEITSGEVAWPLDIDV